MHAIRLIPTFMLLAVVAITPGCASYRTVRLIHNGGDAPPFVEFAERQHIDTTAFAAGDTVAQIYGGYDKVLKSNPTTVRQLVEGKEPRQPSKSERKAQEPSKSERKAQEPSKAERKSRDQASKSERKEKDRQAKREQKANDQSKQARKASGPSKEERKQKRPQLYLDKFVRADGKSVRLRQDLTTEIGLIHGEDPRTVIYSLVIGNGGTSDYRGSLSVLDDLPEGVELVSIREIYDRSPGIGAVLKQIPFLSIIGIFMSDFSVKAVSPSVIGLTDSSSEGQIRLDVDSATIAPEHALVFDILARLPDW